MFGMGLAAHCVWIVPMLCRAAALAVRLVLGSTLGKWIAGRLDLWMGRRPAPAGVDSAGPRLRPGAPEKFSPGLPFFRYFAS